MSGLFDFVLVTADLRATEESRDNQSAVVGRILRQAVDRASADAELLDLAHEIEKRRDDIHQRNYGPQLERLSREMTDAVSALSSGREVRVSPDDTEVPPMKAQFKVSVLDDDTKTSVGKQGHGFQRALIISALQVLAEHGRGSGEGGVICLVIEEPELFQHPLQAKNFARVLRALAGDAANGIQVAYATHSPYFLEPRAFHQVRRVVREGAGSAGSVAVHGSTVENVVARLAGYVDENQVKRQLDSVCMGALAEALFADKVVVTEGTTDCSVINGCADRDRCLLLDGVCTTDAGSKTNVLLPYTVLDELGIPTVMLVDNDRHVEDELMAAAQRSDPDAVASLTRRVTDAKTMNRKLLGFFGLSQSDWPHGRVSAHLVFVDKQLERSLQSEWPEWPAKFAELDTSGSGLKNAAAYYDASRLASGAVPPFIADIIATVRAL
jgi:predicted ATP-dependent endonuclease of OLD family